MLAAGTHVSWLIWLTLNTFEVDANYEQLRRKDTTLSDSSLLSFHLWSFSLHILVNFSRLSGQFYK